MAFVFQGIASGKPMKQLIITIVVLFLAPVIQIGAHPLDISLTTLQIIPSGMYGTTYIHPYELSLLTEDHGLSLQDIRTQDLRRIIFSYFNDHFKIYGMKGILVKESLSIDNDQLYQILAGGLYLNYLIPIDRNEYPITFSVDLFLEFFRTQTNKLILLDESGELYPGSKEIILTARRSQWSFDLNNPDFSSEYDDLTDSDGDGFSDRLENLYGLDPNNADTDGDSYSDFIEFSFGWDPFDKNPSPGQSKEALANSTWSAPLWEEIYEEKEEVSDMAASTQEAEPWEKTPEVTSTPSPINLIEQHNISDKKIPDSRFLEKVLARLVKSANRGFTFGSMLSLLVSVFALGFLHASMPGHGKGVLLSYLSKESRKFRHALGFIATFAITHLIDVIILSFGLKLLSSAYQSSTISQVLKFVGGSGLIIIALFMILSGIREIKNKNNPVPIYSEKNKTPKIRGAAVLGLLTGLAPCPFGWAILMILMSLGKVELIPLIIAVFGLGIFAFLFLVTLVVFFLRLVVLDIFSQFSRYSQLISGVLLLIFGLLFFTPGVPSI